MTNIQWRTAFGRSNYELHLIDLDNKETKDSLCKKITGSNITWIRPIASNRLNKFQWKKCDECKLIKLEQFNGNPNMEP